MSTMKRANSNALTSSSKVRSDTVQVVKRLSGEQIARLEGIAKGSEPRHHAYSGVYREQDLIIQSALRRR